MRHACVSSAHGYALSRAPGAYIFPNGTTLLVCKVDLPPPAGESIRQMQMAVAPHWSGPYKKVEPPSRVFGEDAFIFRQPQDGHFHMLLHSMKPHKLPTTAWSPDGLTWTPAFLADVNCTEGDMYPSFGYEIKSTTGETFRAQRRDISNSLRSSSRRSS